jgi:hypothetical protein
MSRLEFSDGMQFDLSGPLRVVRKADGYYVVGRDTLSPVATAEEGRALVAEMLLDELAAEFPGEELRLEDDDEAPMRFSVWNDGEGDCDIVGAGDTIEEAVAEARGVLLAWAEAAR